MTDLVRIQTRASKRHYLRAKRTYGYGRMSLDLPRKFHEVLKPFLEKQLNIDVKLENDVAVIALSPRGHARAADSYNGLMKPFVGGELMKEGDRIMVHETVCEVFAIFDNLNFAFVKEVKNLRPTKAFTSRPPLQVTA